ncbi:MAG: UDP-N-acetylmuramate--L-alanine ligase, partial [Alicyclobacillus sp.]|nr:UDP-N-acetylmuramate--L-alanine ligase [Alicyclobacillus sp.]
MARPQHVHFVGIGGYGMSAIARVMLDLGYSVSGSDVDCKDLARRLAERGAQVYTGHSAGQVEGADVVVYTTDVPPDNVELQAARERHIPVLHRSEMLARLMADRVGVAVAGAHGKTTTTSMIAYIMERCGLDPTFIIGGVLSNVGDNAKAGSGRYVVAEADESDGSFLHYRPQIAVVTNIEADHLEHYDGDFSKLKAAYERFICQIPEDGLCVMSAQDPHLMDIRTRVSCRVLTFAVDRDADYTAHQIELIDRGSRCVVFFRDRPLGALQLAIPGVHNVMNALAAIAVAREAGVEFPAAAAALQEFRGAKRRFQVVSERDDI